MSVNVTTLSARQFRAIALLASGRSLTSTAKELNLNTRTLMRWCQRPDFLTQLRNAQQRIFEDSLHALRATTKRAIAALTRNLSDKDPRVRHAAAHALLTHALRAHEDLELMGRLEHLENVMANDAGVRLRSV